MNIVVVLPDGREFPDKVPDERHRPKFRQDYAFEESVRRAFATFKVTTPRTDPQKLTVKIYTLVINGLEIERRLTQTLPVQPPLERMTEAEYEAELRDLLEDVPFEFLSYVSSEAYDRGHSEGREQVIQIAQSMVYNLRPVIVDYTQRLVLENSPG